MMKWGDHLQSWLACHIMGEGRGGGTEGGRRDQRRQQLWGAQGISNPWNSHTPCSTVLFSLARKPLLHHQIMWQWWLRLVLRGPARPGRGLLRFALPLRFQIDHVHHAHAHGVCCGYSYARAHPTHRGYHRWTSYIKKIADKALLRLTRITVVSRELPGYSFPQFLWLS